MSGKKFKILVVLVISGISLIASYLVFLNKWTEFTAGIQNQEAYYHNEFTKTKDSIILSMQNEEDFYTCEFNSLMKSISLKEVHDTTFGFFLFSKNTTWEYWNADRLNCLPSIISQNGAENSAQKHIKLQEYLESKVYSGSFSSPLLGELDFSIPYDYCQWRRKNQL
ncbi:MAG: hypothetical protein ACYC1Q_07380 [Bacteroidia bacterium]